MATFISAKSRRNELRLHRSAGTVGCALSNNNRSYTLALASGVQYRYDVITVYTQARR